MGCDCCCSCDDEEKMEDDYYDWDQALQQVNKWKNEGLTVGFTNGCFDIIHSGHVKYLAAAKAKCDRLVMAINSDESVKRLKGPTRPVNDEISRACVIGALKSIDAVVIFGNDTSENDMPIAIIDKLKPDIHFKGGDYTIDQLPEAKVILSYGGRVEIMSLVPGKSTTNIINKMNS